MAAARLILQRIGRTGGQTANQISSPVSTGAAVGSGDSSNGTPVTIRLPTTLIRHNLNASNQGIYEKGIHVTHGPGLRPGPDIELVRRKEHG
jgi:hypothetical protein